MNHWLAAPVMLPLIMAVLMTWPLHNRLSAQRRLALLSTGTLWALTLWILWRSTKEGIDVYLFGNWPAAFGVFFVLDNLSALMLVLSATVSLLALAHAMALHHDSSPGFHGLFQFLLVGLNGIYLTGDLLCLWMFIEVMLLAAIGLRHTENAGAAMVASIAVTVVMLVAIATIYRVTGAVAFADLSQRLAVLSADRAGLLQVGTVLLALALMAKTLVLPLMNWRPDGPLVVVTLIVPSAAAYLAIRLIALIFQGNPATAALVGGLLPVTFAVMAAGLAASLTAGTPARLALNASIAALGIVMVAGSIPTRAGTRASLFLLANSAVAGSVLAMGVDLIGRAGARPKGLVMVMCVAAACSLAGAPLFAGYSGRVMLFHAIWNAPVAPWAAWGVWFATIAGMGLLVLAFAKAAVQFRHFDAGSDRLSRPWVALLPMLVLFGLMVGQSYFADSVRANLAATARQIHRPDDYRMAVMGLPD